jgi:thiol-disulfide isomerase/thioredoxin
MRKSTILLWSAVLTVFIHAQAQSLTIGDKIPDTNKFMISGRKFSLSEFKKKLIILDFWSQKCAGCVASFSRIDALQKEFDSDIQIILINRESAESTSEFFLRHKKVKKPDVLFISADTLFNKFFPHDGEPYHVWLDSSFHIKYMTDAFTATQKSIEQFLDGIDLKARYLTKSKNYIPSLFDSSRIIDVDCFSYLSHCKMNYHLTSLNRNGFNELTVSCVSIVELYQNAYNGSEQMHYKFNRPGRTILEVKDSFRVKRPKDPNQFNEWFENYCYNYQLSLPRQREDEKYQIMKEDLQRYFNLQAKVELRNVHCLTLVRTSTANKLATKSGKTLYNFYSANESTTKIDSIRELINVPYTVFAELLSRYIENAHEISFVDVTNFNGNIDIRLSAKALDTMSIPRLRMELKKYDLDLIEMNLPMEVLVIKDL